MKHSRRKVSNKGNSNPSHSSFKKGGSHKYPLFTKRGRGDLKKNKNRFSFLLATVPIAIILLFVVNVASAGVMVYDGVTPFDKSVKLIALTKGRFFSEGGKLVKFYVNEERIGSALSGGDGYAFLKYIPSSPGVKSLKVESDDETDEGILLITGKNDKVILIAIEGTLFESLFSFKPGKEAKKVLTQLSGKYSIIYLTSLIGIKNSREWLKNNDFPLSTVLKWEGEDMLEELKEKGIYMYAIIGPPYMLSEAPDIKKRFSFEETEDGTEIKDWNALSKQLK